MEFLITFFEGIITFISPCLLPMLPIYVAYFAGNAGTGQRRTLSRTLSNALGFIVGFSAVFCLLGALAGSAGSLLVEYKPVLDAICGTIVVVFGLNYLGAFRIPLLQRTFKLESGIVPRGLGTSFLFGIVFAIGWTPCVGVFLGSALSLAASTTSTLSGVVLLLCYSLGLGIPFAITSVLIDQLEGAFSWVKKHYDAIDKICGVLLVTLGVLMATGVLGSLMAALS